MKNVSKEEAERFYAENRILEITNKLREIRLKSELTEKDNKEIEELVNENKNLLNLLEK